MKKPVVDYRKLRLSNITTPEFSHLLLLLGWVGYFALYFITENFIPAEQCAPVWCIVDDWIPFNEYFLLAYTFWYLLIVFSLGYFLLYDVSSFRKMQTYIIITQVVAMAAYILYPTRQDLRPEQFPRENCLTYLMGIIYKFDTNTGVCPSLHVAYSIGIASTWVRKRDANRFWQAFVVFAVIMICLSTMFVKQHSFVDVVVAIPVCILAEWLVFGKKRPKFMRKMTDTPVV